MDRKSARRAAVWAVLIFVTAAGPVACDVIEDALNDQITAGGIWGRVTDLNGDPISGVTVSIKDGVGTRLETNDTGLFVAVGAADSDELIVQLEKDGYTTTTKTLRGISGHVSATKLTMKRVDLAVATASDDGLAESFAGGNTITVGGSSLVDADGQPAVGQVSAKLTGFDVLDHDQLRAAPGRMTGSMADGGDTKLTSLGMIRADFSDADGNTLQLAPGQTATLEFPVPPGREAVEGEEVATWHFDEDTGKWVEEGTCVIAPASSGEGYACVAEVTHFSSWNADKTVPDPTCVRATIENGATGQALVGATVETIDDQQIAYDYDVTDAKGEVVLGLTGGRDITMTITYGECKFTRGFTSSTKLVRVMENPQDCPEKTFEVDCGEGDGRSDDDQWSDDDQAAGNDDVDELDRQYDGVDHDAFDILTDTVVHESKCGQ